MSSSCQYILRNLQLKAPKDDQHLGCPSDWTEFREALSKINLFDLTTKDLWTFLVSLTELFIERDCQDTFLVSRVLEFAWKVNYMRLSLFQRLVSMLKMYENEILNFDKGILYNTTTTTKFQHLFYQPYKEAKHFRYPKVSAVTFVAFSGEIDALQLLLRFGAMPIEFCYDIQTWPDYFFEIRKKFDKMGSFPLDYLENRLHSKFNGTSRRRLNFVLHHLQFSAIVKDCRPKDYITSLRLLFRAIPEPFVTSVEAIRSLKKLLGDNIKMGEDKELISIAKGIEKCFPESSQPSGPRSLKHLCRCQVRENLRTSKSAFRLPQAIDVLPLPKILKEYVSLKEKEMLNNNTSEATHPHEI